MLVITLIVYNFFTPAPQMHFIHAPRFASVAECHDYITSPDFGVLRERLALEVATHLNPADPFRTREQLAVTSTCELDQRV